MATNLSPDVLCVGHASYDLVFTVPHHPKADEKMVADQFIACGGGPAANAAVTVARLGYRAAYAGYLGNDVYGDMHYAELHREGVITDLVARGSAPTPLSAVLVKPDGSRVLVNYRGETRHLPADAIDFSGVRPKVILFDGHESILSAPLAGRGIPTVLDAGSLTEGTGSLMFAVDYLVCSKKFAREWLGADDPERALAGLSERSPTVIITLGAHGLLWQRGSESGRLPAFPVEPVDTTGAGDTFHGAFATGLAAGFEWGEILRFASAAGALCCTGLGARPAIPDKERLDRFLAEWKGRESFSD